MPKGRMTTLGRCQQAASERRPPAGGTGTARPILNSVVAKVVLDRIEELESLVRSQAERIEELESDALEQANRIAELLAEKIAAVKNKRKTTMFDNLWADLKKIIAAVESPSVESISEALKAAGSLLQNGWDVFKDLFGKHLGVNAAEPLAACKAMVADHERGGGFQAAALDGGMLLNILKLIKMFLELFGS